MLQRLAFTFRTLPTHSKHFEYDQIELKIFGLKDEATKPLEREMAKTINCHHSDVLWNSKIPFPVKFSHRKFPLFSTDIQTFDKNVNLSKQTRKQRKVFFLVFPSLNTSNFTTYPKIASTLTPFWGARLKKVTLPNSEV
jgi:hypothetical protein